MRLLSALGLLLCAQAHAVLTVTMIPFDDACGNGTGWINAMVSGGLPPYNFLWAPAPSYGQGTNLAGGLAAGTYTLTVTDSNADVVVGTATINTIGTLLPTTLSGGISSCDGLCNGSGGLSMNGFAWGGAGPLSASMAPGGSATVTANGVWVSGLCPATTYSCTVTDANGCSSVFNNITPTDYATPVLLNQTITGSCAGGSTGSIVLDYDQVGAAGALDMWGNWQPYLVVGTQVFLNNLAPGQYSVTAYPAVGGGGMPLQVCGVSTTFTVPVSPNPCGSLDGTVYVDLNSDCVQDVSDVPYPNRVLEVQPGNHYFFTNAAGQYATELFYGSYDAQVANALDYNTLCPAVVPAPFTLNGITPTATIDFALESITGPDMSAYTASTTPRPGFPLTYGVYAGNNGAYTFGPFDVTLTYDPVLTFVSSSPAPTVNTPGFLQWSLAGLAPFTFEAIGVQMVVPPNPGLIGTYLDATATVLPVPADGVPANDSYFISRLVVGAYDPNDKQAVTSSRLSATQYFLDADTHIDYTIRFQNTGNAAAINVELVDTLSSLLDIGTLEVLAASHPFTVQLRHDTVLSFRFDNIMLPDSTSDPLGSQGFASFRIAPKSTFALGEVVANNADIYFDFNPPIRTNTVELVADFTTGVMTARPGARIGVMPNPASDAAILTADAALQPHRILLRTATGQVLRDLSWPRGDAQAIVDVSPLPAGLYTVEVRGVGGVAVARLVKE